MIVEKSDVLIIGSGGAGLRCAIELQKKGVDVLVVGKCTKRDAHTILATGGINAALGTMDPKDSWQLHAADTIRDGGLINDPVAVELLCKNAPRAVRELAGLGARFHREKNGKITQRFFGAATYRRACFVGDQTGKEILNVLVDQVIKRNIRFRNEVYVFRLLTKNGAVNGALGLDLRRGKIIVFHAKAVVLATGGHSRVFTRSSSRWYENTGDGIALAYECGAWFMDMEMFQFHPTGMLAPKEAEGVLVTEAVRGEGGILTNAKGERFMKRYDAPRMELSARDVVARAIYMEVQAGRGTRRGGAWLDITHLPKAYILKRLPKIYKQFKDYLNLDISKEKMEVAPTAHYSMGGIYIDHTRGKTTVPNLYAIGEVTSGVHGGNRLGGNSLAEIVVFGKLTGKNIARDVRKLAYVPLDSEQIEAKTKWLMGVCGTKRGQDPEKVKDKIQKMMWADVGVVRNDRDMQKAEKEIHRYDAQTLNVGGSFRMNQKLIAALDVRNIIIASKMIIASARYRKESRAAHYRSDYQQTSKQWQKNILCIPTSRGFTVQTRPIPEVSREITVYLKQKAKVHLLE